jgi:catechol 2,3-dioxygenase-like lactoylglutathione lyase family enzyme
MSTTRIQLALNVEDITEATAFYERLFGVPPHKQRDGYANFVVEDPPLKLVLFESPGAGERLNHLGIEAPTSEQVSAALARFQAAGLQTRLAEQDLCCHAVQDKVFVTAPDVPLGWWEYYTVTDDDPAAPSDATAQASEPCCPGSTTVEGACCT